MTASIWERAARVAAVALAVFVFVPACGGSQSPAGTSSAPACGCGSDEYTPETCPEDGVGPKSRACADNPDSPACACPAQNPCGAQPCAPPPDLGGGW